MPLAIGFEICFTKINPSFTSGKAPTTILLPPNLLSLNVKFLLSLLHRVLLLTHYNDLTQLIDIFVYNFFGSDLLHITRPIDENSIAFEYQSLRYEQLEN